MKVLLFTRRIIKYLGILPLNKKIFITITLLYITVYYPTIKFLVPNLNDLFISSQGIYLLLVMTTTISDNLNFMFYRNNLNDVFYFIEGFIEKRKFCGIFFGVLLLSIQV